MTISSPAKYRFRNNIPALVLIAFAVVFAAWLLIKDLGVPPLGTDEAIHVFVAESLNKSEGFKLPSGGEYVRGKDFSRLVAVSSRFIADQELAARVPSALVTMLNLLIFGGFGWLLGGKWVAFWSVLLLTIFPETITQGRTSRFYSQQITFVLLALAFGWYAIKNAGESSYFRTPIMKKWGLLIVAFALFGLALRVQLTTFSVFAAYIMVLVLVGLLDLKQFGKEAFFKSASLQLVVLGIVIAMAILIFRFDIVERIVTLAFHVPVWAGSRPGDPRVYYWSLVANFPVIISLLPVVFLVPAIRNWKLAIYLAVLFFVPFLLHSLVLPWKVPRYLLSAIPPLLLATSITLVYGLGALNDWLKSRLEELRLSKTACSVCSAIVIFIVSAIFLNTTPAFISCRKFAVNDNKYVHRSDEQSPNWSEAKEILRQHPNLQELPLGADNGLGVMFYLGKVSFVVQLDDLKRALNWAEAQSRVAVENGNVFEIEEQIQGLPDYYSGAPMLTHPDAIKQKYKQYEEVLIIIDDLRWQSQFQLNRKLKEMLANEAVDLCSKKCGSLHLYLWPLNKSNVSQRAY